MNGPARAVGRAAGAIAAVAFAVAVASVLGGCERSQGGTTTTTTLPQASVSTQAIAAVPLGDVAGGAAFDPPPAMQNPYAGNPQAIAQGENLFIKMNCAGCHNYGAGGLIGPSLKDTYWRYGGTPVSVFKSIYEGRPQGMPAWGVALPPQEIWKIVAYLQSLGGVFPADQYQAQLQGDRLGNKVASGVGAAPKTTAVGAARPDSGMALPAEAAPDHDVSPALGASQ